MEAQTQMARLQMTIADELDKQLRELAARDYRYVSDVIRDLLAKSVRRELDRS